MFGSGIDFFGVFRRRERLMNNEETRHRLKDFERQIASGATDISSFFMKKEKLVERILAKRYIPRMRHAPTWKGILRPAVERMASMGRHDGFKRLKGALSWGQIEDAKTLFLPPTPIPSVETPVASDT